MEEKDGLSATYQHKEGFHTVGQMIKHESFVLKPVFTRKQVTFAKFVNQIAYYNALQNNTLWNEIIKPFTQREHSQYGLVAISLAAMVDINKEIWFAYVNRKAKSFMLRSPRKEIEKIN